MMGYTIPMGTGGHRTQGGGAPQGTSALGRVFRPLGISAPSFVLPFFGFAFMRAYNDGVARCFSEAPFGSQWAGEDLYSLVLLAVFLGCALGARRIAPLYRRPAVVALATGLAVLGAALAGIAADGRWGVVPLVGAMGASGVAGALFILLWAELHSCLTPLGIVTYVSGAFLFGSTGAWILQGLDPVRQTLVLAVLPLVSVACLRKSFARIEPVDLPRASWGRYDFPWRLMMVLGVYELAYGVREAAPDFQWDAYTLGVIAVAAVVFSAACLFSRRIDFALIYRTPFALMLCGLAMVPLTATFGAFASDLLVSSGYALMFLVLTFLLCDLSHRYGVSVLVLCGVEELTAIFRLIGHQVPEALASGALPAVDGAAVSVGLTVLVVLASMLLLFGRSASEPWGAAFFGVGAMAAESDERGQIVERCAELARAHGLSAREREVLELVALGRSSTQIERELVIANGTLKSHRQRIYQKLGVHSKKELRDLVDVGDGA